MELKRGLKSRHVELIAIGGAIGVGLFLGSAKAIQNGGPGLILGYAFGGLVIFFIMRALGELLLYRPVAGSFVIYADEFVGPFAGFVTGWSYWFMWVVTGMAELTAIGVYVGYWLPDFPQWISVLAALVVLYSANMLAVRAFGEMEFWFALIKVAMIVMLIVGGLAVIFFRVGDLGATAGFSNLWSHGGFLPFGILGVLLTFQMVMYAFQGVELIGVTAGEAENPEVGSVSAAFMPVGVLLNYLVPDQVFVWVTSIALIGTLWTWAIIVLAHLGYRKAVDAGRAHGVSFRMPGAPLANWLVVGFLIVVAALLSIEPGTRVALYVAPIWFGLLGVAYVRMKPRPRQNMDLAAGPSPLP
jgi:L-asparagine transporter-like permease